MKWLVLLHVLSAIIGVGPVYFSHVLFRRSQTLLELKHSVKLAKRLEIFPKVGGTLAVLSGLALFFLGDYGMFTQLWLLGSLVLYIIIQVVAAGIIPTRSKKLAALVENVDGNGKGANEAEVRQHLQFVNNWMYVASAFGTLLFIFMIMKP